ncbi:MAG TPA: molybdate ABC transporter permease subunit, partial [Frankiaceae bacterium]|nr:molybdate ABC transporter permease subunit [Frankiaceae bacterium]
MTDRSPADLVGERPARGRPDRPWWRTGGRPRRPWWRTGGGPPVPLALAAAVGVAFLVLPLVGLLVRAPWRRLPGLLGEPAVRDALTLSLLTATVSAGVSLLLGVPLAWILARVAFPGRSLLRAAVTLPLVLPPVVGGVGLLLAFGRRG